MMGYIRLIFKIILLICVAIVMEMIVLLLQLFTAPFGYRQKTGAFVATFWGRIYAKILRVKIRVYGSKPKLKEGIFYISNHSSYVDIFILYCLFLINFVAKSEVRKWPLIGFFAYCGGTIFVNRKKTTDAKKYVHSLLKTMKKGSNILIFPEGTSSRGDEILPFFSSLFQAPLESRISIHPVYIQYYGFNGKKIKDNPELIDNISWYGDMELAPHLSELLKAKSIEIRVFNGNIIKTSDFNVDSAGRKALTAECYDEILRLKKQADNLE